MKQDFIPCTTARAINSDVFFRPVRSWHSGTFSGEKLEVVRGDRSGCARKEGAYSWSCPIPLSVTHRLYWHKNAPDKTISAFLSYPNGLGCADEYFWETYGLGEDVERWFGDNAETEMEAAIVVHFTNNRS